MVDLENRRRRTATAVKAATAGGSVAAERFRTDLAVEYKTGKMDTVTQADRDAQQRVIEVIHETFPGEAIVGEEDDALKSVPETGPVWIIDPIDGTNNYVRGNRIFATAVAAIVDGEAIGGAVVCPALGDSYRVGPDGVARNGAPVTVSECTDPERGSIVPTLWWDHEQARLCSAIADRFGEMRRYGCAQATLALVASGELEGAVSNREAHPWDTVAGVRMVRAAGGTVTDRQGDPWTRDSSELVVSNGHLHEDVLAVARATTD